MDLRCPYFLKMVKRKKESSSTPLNSAKQKYSMGFTLLELLIVIAVIAILAAIVLVELDNAKQSAWEARGLQFSQNIRTTLATDLVLEWSFDETSGTIATDSSGNGYYGTLVNGPVWTTEGKVRNALRFNGNNNYVYRSDNTSPELDVKNVTLAAWVYVNEQTGNWQGIAWKNTAYELALYSTLYPRFGITNTSNTRVVCDATSKILSTKKWYYLVLTYDGSKIRGYINGQEARNPCNQTGEIINNASDFSVSNATYDFNGTIDEVRIYKTALTAYEIKALYAEGKMRHLAEK